MNTLKLIPTAISTLIKVSLKKHSVAYDNLIQYILNNKDKISFTISKDDHLLGLPKPYNLIIVLENQDEYNLEIFPNLFKLTGIKQLDTHCNNAVIHSVKSFNIEDQRPSFKLIQSFMKGIVQPEVEKYIKKQNEDSDQTYFNNIWNDVK